MSHYWDSGFVTRKPAWHGLANVVPDYITDFEEARVAADMTWDVVEHPVFTRHRREVEGVVTETYKPIPDMKGISRNDNGLLMSVQADTYGTFFIRDLGDLCDAIMGNADDVQYECMMSLKEGRKVAIVMRLKDPFEVPGDPKGRTLSRCAVQNSFDGSGSLRVQMLNTRIECDNTSRMADDEARRFRTEYTFRHTASISERVEEAKQVIASLRDQRQVYVDWADRLLGIDITPQQEEEFISRFFAMPPVGTASDRVIANVEEARNLFRSIMDDGDGTMPERIRGTAYGLVQGAVEYLDHKRNYRSKETYVNRTYLSDDGMKRKAERLVLNVAGV